MSVPARKESESRILRFGLPSRIAHWGHAIAFLLLLLTGLGLVFKGIVGVSTLKLFGNIHRMMAWPFTFLAVFILIFGAPKALRAWLAAIVRFDSDDRRFLAIFPKEFFGGKVKLPAQGKFNAGEKLNSLLQIVGWMVMVVTGWILVFKDKFPEAFKWALPIHSFTALLLGAAVLGHIYLALGHPSSRVALSGMINGLVPRSWARSHHKKWTDELGE